MIFEKFLIFNEKTEINKLYNYNDDICNHM